MGWRGWLPPENFLHISHASFWSRVARCFRNAVPEWESKLLTTPRGWKPWAHHWTFPPKQWAPKESPGRTHFTGKVRNRDRVWLPPKGWMSAFKMSAWGLGARLERLAIGHELGLSHCLRVRDWGDCSKRRGRVQQECVQPENVMFAQSLACSRQNPAKLVKIRPNPAVPT